MAVAFTFKVTENTSQRVLTRLSKGIPKSIARSIERAVSTHHAASLSLVPTRTRLLLRSIRRVARPDFGIVGISSTEAFYARFIEFGTKHIARRPYIKPAFDKARRRHFSAKTVLQDLNL